MGQKYAIFIKSMLKLVEFIGRIVYFSLIDLETLI